MRVARVASPARRRATRARHPAAGATAIADNASADVVAQPIGDARRASPTSAVGRAPIGLARRSPPARSTAARTTCGARPAARAHATSALDPRRHSRRRAGTAPPAAAAPCSARALVSAASVAQRARVADPSQRQHGIVLQRTVELGDRGDRVDRVRGAVVAERFDHRAAEEVEAAPGLRDQRALHLRVVAERRKRARRAPGGRTRPARSAAPPAASATSPGPDAARTTGRRPRGRGRCGRAAALRIRSPASAVVERRSAGRARGSGRTRRRGCGRPATARGRPRRRRPPDHARRIHPRRVVEAPTARSMCVLRSGAGGAAPRRQRRERQRARSVSRRATASAGDGILLDASACGSRRASAAPAARGLSFSASCRYAASSRGNATGYTPV